MARSPEWVTLRQKALGPSPLTNRTERDFRRHARWLELEAMRGYPSSRRTLWYAANMRIAAARRKLSGTAEPWTRGVDSSAEQCPVCEGPVSGRYGCGGCPVPAE